MTDLSKLSDDDLRKLYSGVSPAASMSDDELKASYQPAQKRTVMGVLTGSDGGERYQTWPERAVRSMFSLPQRAMEAAASGDTESMVPVAAETAMVATPLSRAPALFGAKPTSVAAPSAQALEQAVSRGYKSARESGVTVPTEQIPRIQQTIEQRLMEQGYLPATAPKTFGVLKEMSLPAVKEGEAVAPVSLSSMEAMRRGFQKAGADRAESDAARRAVEVIDETLSPLSPELKDARANAAALFRSGDLDVRMSRAERQAQKSGSGANIDNAIRQKVSQPLDTKGGTRGWSPEEIAQAERVVEGTSIGNTARLLSKLSPQHPVTGWPASVAAAVGGTAAGGPLGGLAGAVGVPVLGMIAKKTAENSTRRQANILDEMMRSRSPLAQQMLSEAQRENPQAISAIARMLLEDQMQQNQIPSMLRRPQPVY